MNRVTLGFLLSAVSLGQEATEVKSFNADETKFMEYIIEFGKSYSTREEFEQRLKNFIEMDKYIAEVNAPGSEYTHEAGHNEYSDWSQEQFKKLLGAKQPEDHKKKVIDPDVITEEDNQELNEGRRLQRAKPKAPAKVDWIAAGKVTPVKDQGYCGSCWAFVTTGAMESDHAIKGNKLTSLSEQQLIDCSGEYWGNWGCQGGWQYYGWYYTQYYGLENMNDYPYLGYQSKCSHNPRRGLVSTERGAPFHEVGDHPEQIKLAVAVKPQAAAIKGYSRLFQSYRRGVISSTQCGDMVDHAVLIVGYDTTNGKNHWIVKNSWAKRWGQNGFGYIKISEGKGVCGINQFVSGPNTVAL